MQSCNSLLLEMCSKQKFIIRCYLLWRLVLMHWQWTERDKDNYLLYHSLQLDIYTWSSAKEEKNGDANSPWNFFPSLWICLWNSEPLHGSRLRGPAKAQSKPVTKIVGGWVFFSMKFILVQIRWERDIWWGCFLTRLSLWLVILFGLLISERVIS